MSHSLTRRWKLVLLCSLLVASLAPLGVAGATQYHDRDDYEPDPRTAVRGPVAASLPADPALFGVLPGTAPWAIDEGHVRVRSDGTLRLRVRGLVIPTPPANGTNPVPLLSASVYCSGALVATSKTVPFSPKGDARINQDLGELPAPCANPGVLVHPNDNTTRYIGFNEIR